MEDIKAMKDFIRHPISLHHVSQNYQALGEVRDALEDLAREQGRDKWFFDDGEALRCLLRHVIQGKKSMSDAFLDAGRELKLL